MKQQKIIHNQQEIEVSYSKDIFTVTSDSVSLVEFIKLKASDKQIIDFGSGIGTIPFLLSTSTKKEIIGFEIQKELVRLSNYNIQQNHKEDQIKIIFDRIQNANHYFPSDSVSLIVSNPPYFKKESTPFRNAAETKSIARHEIEITFEELVQSADKILKNHGRFVFIHRTERLIEIIETLRKYKLEPKRIKLIYTKQNKNAILFLMEAVKKGNPGLKIEPPEIRERNEL